MPSDIRGIERRDRRRHLRRSVSGNSLGDQMAASTPSLHGQSATGLPASGSELVRRRETFTKRKSLAPQRRFTQVVPPNVLLTITQQELQRQEIIFELMITERQYVDDITMTVEQFLVPLREQELLSKEQLNSVFGNLEALVPVNTEILSALEERKRKFGAVIERVGDIFLDRINLFKLYAIYCSNQRAVATRILELSAEVPEFKQFCAVAHKKAFCRGMCLPDFLIGPLQRLCKYPLIFENLLEHTPATHPDHEKLSAAHAAIKEIVTKVNERTRQVENVEKLSELEKQYHFSEAGLDIVQADRSLVKKGPAKYNKRGKVPSACELFLFNDCFLVVVNKKGSTHVPLNAPIGDVLLSNTDTEDLHFDLVVLRQFSVQLHFETSKEKKAWLVVIRKYRLLVTDLPVGEEERIRVRHNTFAGWLSPRSLGKVNKLEEGSVAASAPASAAASAPGSEPAKAASTGQQTHISPVLSGKPVLFQRHQEKAEPEDAEKKLKLQRMTQVQLTVQKLGSDKEKINMLRYLLEKEIETTCEMRTMLLQTVAKQSPVSEANGECRRCASVGRERSGFSDGWTPRRAQSTVAMPSLSRRSVSPSRRKTREEKAQKKERAEHVHSMQVGRDGSDSEKEATVVAENSAETSTTGDATEKKEEKEAEGKGGANGGPVMAPDGGAITITVESAENDTESTKDENAESKKRTTESASLPGRAEREVDSEQEIEAEKKESEKEEARKAIEEEEKKEREWREKEEKREAERNARVLDLEEKLKRAEMEIDVANLQVEKMRSGGKEREKNTELLSKTMEIVKDNEELVRQRNELEELVLSVKSVVENSDDTERGFHLVKERLASFQPSSREMPSNHVLNRVRFFEMLNKEIAAQKNQSRGTPSSSSNRRRRYPSSSPVNRSTPSVHRSSSSSTSSPSSTSPSSRSPSSSNGLKRATSSSSASRSSAQNRRRNG